jgi:RimJ/RimL family protein N-acetyltransferase
MTRHELHTPRLHLRAWREDDREPFAQLNADPEVMRWFPATQDRVESDATIERLKRQHDDLGWTFWAVQVLDSARGPAPFVGFVGLTTPRFGEPPFPHADPCVEIGWRLSRDWWGLGIATEAAGEALRFALDELALPEVISYTVPPNLASQAVMQRLGMHYDGVFHHPRASAQDWWGPHVLYRRARDDSGAAGEASGRTHP